ncbi:hypothetical protein DRO50_01080 [Candidatus Bathyarchaeota archaeon]|nr:MAG: hypothetical protein DRO50_01080 [Candidatus Bathyarchaeota archaeon]
MTGKRWTVLLGVLLTIFLALSYVENVAFFNNLKNVFENPFLAISVIFIHNVLAVSLIFLSMTFYVNLVLTFFPKKRYEYIVLEHPRIFAFVFTAMIIVIGILRGTTLLYGGVSIEALPLILLISTPVALIEGYGIYLTIKKTLGRTMRIKDMAFIYLIFLVAAVMEISFIYALIHLSEG